jgi:hypothetical protein
VLIEEEEYLAHYGIIRKSGRYPWGSGGDSFVTSNNRDFLDTVAKLKKDGLKETEIAQGFGMTTAELRAAKSLAKSEKKAADQATAQRLKDKGMSNVAIGKQMGIPESTVRSLLAPGLKDKEDLTLKTASILREFVDKNGLTDVGNGVENYLNVSKERLNTALQILKSEGYNVYTNIKVRQLGTDFETNFKVLAPPGTTFGDVSKNRYNIKAPNIHLDDTGKTILGMLPPLPLNPKRISINYKEDGGEEADGVIYMRPGVEDLSIGGSRYAQVRIQVGKSHYMKGMAIYKNDLPDGVDVVFNTNKSKSDVKNKLDVLKPLSDDPDNPFGATVSRQITKPTKDGKQKVTSVMNILTEEGQWGKWSKSISTQVLSKQTPQLAKEQLDMTYERRANDLKTIKELTNPAVRKKLLDEFADGTDAASVHLSAASLPRQAYHVIMPIRSLKPSEIYAPNYKNGEEVVLIRFPHGGTFEIPKLKVNNKHKESKDILGDALDAVGINAKVAERLSGADFDGDTVLVIPNNNGKITSTAALEGLKNFNPRITYKEYPGMKVMSNTQRQMGEVSNLITDMTIKGAPTTELAAAVRHSMVVIDAEKHKLNYKQSEIDNNIKNLKAKYQAKPDGGRPGGASTLISRAQGQERVPKFKPRSMAKGGPIDKDTGERVFEPTGEVSWRTGKPLTTKVERLSITKDARTLSSGTRIENLYADQSNKLKALANEARRESVKTPSVKYSPSANKVYKNEVNSLNNKLTLAQLNAPRERQAQLLANSVLQTKKDANPNLDKAHEKRLKAQALTEARNRTGAKKQDIKLTPKEWEAIQAGAISNHKLTEILRHADMDVVRELATPRTQVKMTSAKTKRAESMLALGYTRAEVAQQLGVSLSTLDLAVEGGE